MQDGTMHHKHLRRNTAESVEELRSLDAIAKSESLNKVKIERSVAGSPGVLQVPKNKDQTANVVPGTNTPRISGKHVLETQDAHPFMVHTKAQAQLHHGVDLKKLKAHESDAGATKGYAISGIGTNATGKKVIVKGRLPNVFTNARSEEKDPSRWALGPHYEDLTTAQREGLYHNAAHVLGLGKYVPLTSVVQDDTDPNRHGPNGNHYSIQEKIPNAEHYNEEDVKHQQILNDTRKSGDLDKITLMNTLLGNTDRHGNNFMVSPKGMHLIDHGLSFDFQGQSGRDIFRPRYYDHAYSKFKDPTDDDTDMQVHPKAIEWLKNIKPEDMKSFFKKHKVHQDFSQPVMKALQHAQNVVNSNRGIGMNSLRDAIKGVYKDFPYKGSQFDNSKRVKPTMMGS
jgi:hypothetical protein